MKYADHEIMVSQYIDNELIGEELNMFIDHLNDCNECRELLFRYQNYKDHIKEFYSSLSIKQIDSRTLKNKPTIKQHKFTFIVASTVVVTVLVLFNLVSLNDSSIIQINNKEINSSLDQRVWRSDIYGVERKLDNLRKEIESDPF